MERTEGVAPSGEPWQGSASLRGARETNCPSGRSRTCFPRSQAAYLAVRLHPEMEEGTRDDRDPRGTLGLAILRRTPFYITLRYRKDGHSRDLASC